MARLAGSNVERGVFEERSPKAYFVQDTRIDCDLCRQTAPFYFAQKHGGPVAHGYVQREPLTVHQERAWREALEACPVEAMGYKLA